MPYKELLRKIDSYAKVIREHRPLTPDEVKELDSYFRIGMTYSSNALEGNSLTLSETKVLLEDGITVGGKPIRDCYEATGHAQAYDYMLQLSLIHISGRIHPGDPAPNAGPGQRQAGQADPRHSISDESH